MEPFMWPPMRSFQWRVSFEIRVAAGKEGDELTVIAHVDYCYAWVRGGFLFGEEELGDGRCWEPLEVCD